jgi:hypothetical protein
VSKQRNRRTPLIAVLGSLAALAAVPAAAQAHHVDSEAKCVLVDNAPVLQLDAKFIGFGSAGSQESLTGKVTVDGAVKFDGAVPAIWNGLDGTWTYSQPAIAGKQYSVLTNWAWNNETDGEQHTTTACPTPTPPVTPPTTTPPTTTPPTTPPPAGEVLPETIASGTARLRGPSGCVKQAFRARVTGRSIAAVAFYLDGKLMKRITGERAVYRMTVNPGRYGFGRHKIVARVKFVAGSGTSVRRMPLTFRRCAQGAVAPRFTG